MRFDIVFTDPGTVDMDRFQFSLSRMHLRAVHRMKIEAILGDFSDDFR